jgi:(1->4)-alpha-D-glucan 1-alpha-D-glucosylmutase
MHFQQVTGPVSGQGVRGYGVLPLRVRLLALNEVGGDPRRFGLSVAAFHHQMRDRLRARPRAMVTTATHDTKRGEDARIRLALTSEMPREWGRRVTRWLRLNRSCRSQIDDEPVPGRDVEYLFYQSLLGAWPWGLAPDDRDGMRDLAERLESYMIKAVREGKEQSSWSNPNGAHEAALQRFVHNALDASRPNLFLADFHDLVALLAPLGAISSLSQLVLKLTVPGVPDIYQGGELWDFSLVDPDNRRPVDWNARRALLEAIGEDCVADPAARRQDGHAKLFMTCKLLAFRRSQPELLAEGDYQPLEVTGSSSEHLCTFMRSRGEKRLVIAVPRLVHRLYRDGAADWGATSIALPAGSWRDVLTGGVLDGGVEVPVSRLLADVPVAVLDGENDAR